MIGDISWITNQPHLHTVIADEQVLVLAIPCSSLEEQLANDGLFAKQFFHTFSKNYASHLTELDTAHAAQQPQDLSPSKFTKLDRYLRNFKALFARTDKVTPQSGIASLEDISQLKAQPQSLSAYISIHYWGLIQN